MDTNILACLKTADGKTVSLSTGLVTLSNEQYPVLHAFSANYGELQVPLVCSCVDSSTRFWSDAIYRPHCRGDEKAVARLKPELNSIACSELSSPHVFWIESEHYTHVLMDGATRRMVGVKPWVPKEVEWHNPWEEVMRGFDNPDQWAFLPGDERADSDGNFWYERSEADRRKVYACLHPAPVVANGAAVWAFGGIPFVRINRPEPGVWEPTFLTEMVEIQYEGQAFV